MWWRTAQRFGARLAQCPRPISALDLDDSGPSILPLRHRNSRWFEPVGISHAYRRFKPQSEGMNAPAPRLP